MNHLFTALLFMMTLSLNLNTGLGQSKSREDLLSELQSKRVELQQLETQFLAPAPADQSANAAFLSQPDTGLIRLLPRELYDSEAYKKKTRH